DLMASMGEELAAMPGVLQVTDERESVQTVVGVSEFAQRAMLVVGIGLLVAALLLILNAIRMAMYARRREIEVMKLVGATNWFIRVPFMLEGIVQGLIGAIFALGAVFALDRFMQRAAQHEDYRAIMEGFVATSGELWFTVVVVLVLGVVIGAAGSGWALRGFLKVGAGRARSRRGRARARRARRARPRPGQAARVTGSDSRPRSTMRPFHRGRSVASSMRGKRRTSAGTASMPSSRARAWPRQWWMPLPNDRWALAPSRPRSRSSAVGPHLVSSRLDDPSSVSTKQPGGMVSPASST